MPSACTHYVNGFEHSEMIARNPKFLIYFIVPVESVCHTLIILVYV